MTTQYAKTTLIPPTKQPAPRSAAARMRAHRDRRRDGLRCFMVQLFEAEIEELIRRGLLKDVARNDRQAVCEALYAHLDQTLRAAS